MHEYGGLIALLLTNDIFEKQHALYASVERNCEALAPLTLADFAQERIFQCEIWFPDFKLMEPSRQLIAVLHNGAFALMLAQQKCLLRM